MLSFFFVFHFNGFAVSIFLSVCHLNAIFNLWGNSIKRLEKPYSFQQFEIVVLSPNQDGTKQEQKFNITVLVLG